VNDEVLEAEAVEEPVMADAASERAVRPLPQTRSGAELAAWRGEARVVAIAAAGGIAAGAATVAAVNAVRRRAQRQQPTRVLRRGRKGESVLASRSFLVDVHLLDRR
jgi:hypothetical protein